MKPNVRAKPEPVEPDLPEVPECGEDCHCGVYLDEADTVRLALKLAARRARLPLTVQLGEALR